MKTDIIATIGPSSNSTEIQRQMIEAGMTVARLNFSWGTHEEHRHFVASVRQAAEQSRKPIALMQDVSGPRVQTGPGHTYDADVVVLTDKDRADIAALADLRIEFIAQSFVKDAADIEELRTYLQSIGSTSRIIAKIERLEALDNLDAILATADGVMIARGDLGEEVPYAELPFVKKDILARAREAEIPAIVATEMLTSMIDSEKPSRADVSDIAHAILDGAGATMLSNETAVGKHPVQAVAVMREVVAVSIKRVPRGVAGQALPQLSHYSTDGKLNDYDISIPHRYKVEYVSYDCQAKYGIESAIDGIILYLPVEEVLYGDVKDFTVINQRVIDFLKGKFTVVHVNYPDEDMNYTIRADA